ncbi:PDR/VanB family oxidoreductase [Pseudomonas promysalinigenes]|uniref:PDR/VanB family oxidoreductase n=1 Tax=Pseudomonas promysalinigenes TaxID=485898 RepID=UPI00271916A9
MLEVIVTRKKTEAVDICSFELALIDGGQLPPFTAGSHIDVYVAPGIVRQYSLCNTPGENHHYQIAVLLDANSRGGSRGMHQEITEGQTLTISEPRNLFPLAHAAAHTLLFAGGIGITPILCMAERLHQTNASFELHYSARAAERAAFRQRINKSGFATSASYYFDDTPSDSPLDMSKLLANPTHDKHLYVCGPSGYMDFVIQSALKAGWHDGNIHREYFTASADLHAGGSHFEVQVASSGKVFVIPEGQAITEVLANAGIEIPVSCEQGVCGTCITRILEGEPEHRDVFLTNEEKALNDQFTPCCSRAKTSRLVLDL